MNGNGHQYAWQTKYRFSISGSVWLYVPDTRIMMVLDVKCEVIITLIILLAAINKHNNLQ